MFMSGGIIQNVCKKMSRSNSCRDLKCPGFSDEKSLFFCSTAFLKCIVSCGVSECRAFPDPGTGEDSSLPAYDAAGESTGAGKETISGAGRTSGT